MEVVITLHTEKAWHILRWYFPSNLTPAPYSQYRLICEQNLACMLFQRMMIFCGRVSQPEKSHILANWSLQSTEHTSSRNGIGMTLRAWSYCQCMTVLEHKRLQNKTKQTKKHKLTMEVVITSILTSFCLPKSCNRWKLGWQHNVNIMSEIPPMLFVPYSCTLYSDASYL